MGHHFHVFERNVGQVRTEIETITNSYLPGHVTMHIIQVDDPDSRDEEINDVWLSAEEVRDLIAIVLDDAIEYTDAQ